MSELYLGAYIEARIEPKRADRTCLACSRCKSSRYYYVPEKFCGVCGSPLDAKIVQERDHTRGPYTIVRGLKVELMGEYDDDEGVPSDTGPAGVPIEVHCWLPSYFRDNKAIWTVYQSPATAFARVSPEQILTQQQALLVGYPELLSELRVAYRKAAEEAGEAVWSVGVAWGLLSP